MCTLHSSLRTCFVANAPATQPSRTQRSLEPGWIVEHLPSDFLGKLIVDHLRGHLHAQLEPVEMQPSDRSERARACNTPGRSQGERTAKRGRPLRSRTISKRSSLQSGIKVMQAALSGRFLDNGPRCQCRDRIRALTLGCDRMSSHNLMG